MGCELFLDFFSEHEVPVIRKRRHTFLKMEDENVYVLKDNIKSQVIPIKVVIPGDVNYNGIIQPNDATAVLQHVAGLVVLEDYRQVAADVHGKGIDPNDAVAILKYCAGYDIELK